MRVPVASTISISSMLELLAVRLSFPTSTYNPNLESEFPKRNRDNFLSTNLRILELLRLTDPNHAAATRSAGLAKAIGRGGEGAGGGGDGEEEEVPEELIGQHEDRVAEAEVRRWSR